MVVHIAPKGERNKSVNPLYADEHNRYAILQKHPEIYFSTMPLRFENREEAIAWICRNQLGRRNLSPEQKPCQPLYTRHRHCGQPLSRHQAESLFR